MRNKGHTQKPGVANWLPINDQIRSREVMLIDDEAGTRAVMSREDALKLAGERELDLVVVAPHANPPVARILEYGKYRYEQERAARKQKQNHKTQELKEIRLTPRMEEHDRAQRVKQAQGFLEDGHRLHISMRFRGRENLFKERGIAAMREFAEALTMAFETEPRAAGNTISVNLIPKKKDETKNQ